MNLLVPWLLGLLEQAGIRSFSSAFVRDCAFNATRDWNTTCANLQAFRTSFQSRITNPWHFNAFRLADQLCKCTGDVLDS